MKSNLIRDPSAITARAADKRSRLLRWLRDFTWSSVPVAGQVMGLRSRSMALKTIRKMEREELVTVHPLPVVGRSLLLVGLAPAGLLWAMEEGEDFEERPTFDPSRVTLYTLNHRLELQRARLQAECVGWTGWVHEYRMPRAWEYKPDGVATRPDGQVVAIELERSVKTSKRYKSLVSEHLRAMARDRYQQVHYVCPQPGLAARLGRLFDSFDAVKNSRRDTVSFAGGPLRARFSFFSLEGWPDEHR